MTSYNYSQLQTLIESIFLSMGCPPKDASDVAEVLLSAELRGIPSHGLVRIKDYYQLFKAGRINVTPNVRVVHEKYSLATVDGDGALGIVAAKRSMEIAIERASKYGSGWVATKHSNHFSIGSYYTDMATENDMIGMSMTNANPLVAPTFSTSKMLGTNPLAVSVPAGKYPSFVADFASTPIARGKLAIMEKKGLQAPEGIVQDKDGVPSTDPSIITKGGAILPLGGDSAHGSHKGYCLGAIIDVFSAVFSGANFGPFVPPQVAYLPLLNESVGEGLGHFFGAMCIDEFRPKEEFKASMDKWIETFKNATPAVGQDRVYIPGEIERESEAKLLKEGISLMPNVEADLSDICNELNIAFLS